jgi:DNA-binding transcriptional MerR regulator
VKQTREEFTETTSAIAAKSGSNANLVRLYADQGLIESRKLSNGVRLLRPSAANQVRAIKAKNLKKRGRRSSAV